MALRTRRGFLVTVTCLLVFSLMTTTIHPLNRIPSISTPNQMSNSPVVYSSLQPALAEEITSVEGSRAPLGAPTPITNYSIDALLLPLTHVVNGSSTINYVNHANIPLSELLFHFYPNVFIPDGSITLLSINFDNTLITSKNLKLNQ